jgi:D-glycero-D-manno-heptose 1,7-bisphosphate phosphatase
MDERSTQKAVFLDRDNTIIKDDGYFHDPNAIIFVPNAPEGLLKLQQAGFLLFVITNQSGIGRGYFPESDTIAVNDKIIELLRKQGVRLEKIYYCPHAPEADCPCRKPKPFLILKAAEEFGVDTSKSFFIGDHMKDMEAGRAARTTTVLIDPTGKVTSPDIDISASNLIEAAEKITSYETLYGSI